MNEINQIRIMMEINNKVSRKILNQRYDLGFA